MRSVQAERAQPVDRRPPPALHFRGVGKQFPDGTQALTDVDLSIATGEFVTVVGPSGCGKSTLLKIASGLTGATTGAVENTAGRLGYVFQDPTLLPWRTVQRNVELLAELHGVGKAERAENARQAIELVGLQEFAGHRPWQLSGGMRMRVSLARSLTLSPQVFLFDEPFGALDEITRDRLNDELLTLFTDSRFATLFITHSVNEAVYLSTRVVVMSGRPGRLVEDLAVPFGYPREPELRFTPEFAAFAGAVSARLRGSHA